MNFLELIHSNRSGSVYAIKNGKECENFDKVQLHIGEVAVLLMIEEVSSFLKVIDSAKKNCNCDTCATNDTPYKRIKCNTKHTELIIKGTPELIDDLEELALAVIHIEEMDNFMTKNNIEGLIN